MPDPRAAKPPESNNPHVNVAGAGIRVAGGSATISDVDIRETNSAYGGAGLGMVGGAQVTILDTSMQNMFSATGGINGSGTGISANNCGNLHMERCDLSNGVNGNDAGLLLARNTPFSALDCSFTFGVTSVSAGAVMLVDCASATLEGCLVEDCNSNNRGGGMFVENCGSLTMTECAVIRNLGKQEGGGLYVEGTPISFTDCRWEDNAREVFPASVVNKGGGVRAVSCSGSVTRCCFVREISNGWGGGWSNAGGQVTFEDCVFDGARSKIFGGGLHAELAGGATLTRTLFRGCSGLLGGALGASFTAQLSLDRCTLVDNAGVTSGAGMYLDTGAEAVVASSIVARATHGDLIHCSSGSVVLTHSNVWNDAATNSRPEFGGTCPDPVGTDGNLSDDPQFCVPPGAPPYCDPSTTAYTLGPGSPCAGAGVDGVDMGWRGVGCSATSASTVESTSWGRLKARFR